MAWRGFDSIATSVGFPEKIVDAHPQSLSPATENDRDGGELLLEVATRYPLFDRASWFSEKAITPVVDEDTKERRRQTASLILLM